MEVLWGGMTRMKAEEARLDRQDRDRKRNAQDRKLLFREKEGYLEVAVQRYAC